MLSSAGLRLYALGRLGEAVESMLADAKITVKQNDWVGAAQAANNISELQLTLGNAADAMASVERSLGYFDQYGSLLDYIAIRTTRANILHLVGEPAKALALFLEAEQIQEEFEPEYPRLYSVMGFRYCDLLLAQGNSMEVLERAGEAFEWSKQQGVSLLNLALDQLSLGCAHHAQNNLPLAHNWLGQAVVDLRKAGVQDFLLHGLLARAALWRDLNEYTLAQQDLAEVWEIAEPSGRRLFMTDYHLEMARLLLKNPMHSPAKEKTLSLADHINAAETLINETGYHRRDDELAALKMRTCNH